MIDSAYLRSLAKRCRELEADAVKWSVRERLSEMATDIDRTADELEAEEAASRGRRSHDATST